MPIRKKVILGALLLALATHSSAFARIGAEGSGGGNGDTDRNQDTIESFQAHLQKVRGFFGDEEGTRIRTYLKTFLGDISPYQSQGPSSAKLQELISKGLLDDIDQTPPYVFSDRCVETDDGVDVEKDASTIRGERNAPICINLGRIASKGESLAEVIGLLMHEHARHFGEEDTIAKSIPNLAEPLEVHPLAVFVARHFGYFDSEIEADYVLDPGLKDRVRNDMPEGEFQDLYENAKPVQRDIVLNYKVSDRNLDTLWIYSTEPGKVRVVIDGVKGSCPKKLKTVWTPKEVKYDLKPGTHIPMSDEDSTTWMEPDYFLDLLQDPLGTCEIEISVENAFGKSPVGSFKISGRIPSFVVTKVDMTEARPSKKSL